MFNSNDILARLQNGENPEAIACEMTDALNNACEQFFHKDTNLETAANALNTYIRENHPDLVSVGADSITADHLKAMFDSIAPIVPALKSLADLESMLGDEARPSRGHRANVYPVDEDAVIGDFLKRFAK